MRVSTVLALTIALVLLVPLYSAPRLVLIPPVRAASISWFLNGSASVGTAGWNKSIPGPTLTARQSDSVTLTLNSTDNLPHRFFIDVDNSGTVPSCPSPPDLCSDFFGGTSPRQIVYMFTLNFGAGTFNYYCSVHPTVMFGTFQVLPLHDAGVSKITVSRNFAYSGVTSNPIQLNVTATNSGAVTDTFYVAAKANSTLIGNQTVTIPAGGTAIVTFNWNTQPLARGIYTLTAQATLSGDGNPSNNLITDGTFTVKLKGDVNGDCKVDIVDLATVGSTFGKVLGTAGYNPNADLNNDGVINIVDLVVVGGSFGQTCP